MRGRTTLLIVVAVAALAVSSCIKKWPEFTQKGCKDIALALSSDQARLSIIPYSMQDGRIALDDLNASTRQDNPPMSGENPDDYDERVQRMRPAVLKLWWHEDLQKTLKQFMEQHEVLKECLAAKTIKPERYQEVLPVIRDAMIAWYELDDWKIDGAAALIIGQPWPDYGGPSNEANNLIIETGRPFAKIIREQYREIRNQTDVSKIAGSKKKRDRSYRPLTDKMMLVDIASESLIRHLTQYNAVEKRKDRRRIERDLSVDFENWRRALENEGKQWKLLLAPRRNRRSDDENQSFASDPGFRMRRVGISVRAMCDLWKSRSVGELRSRLGDPYLDYLKTFQELQGAGKPFTLLMDFNGIPAGQSENYGLKNLNIVIEEIRTQGSGDLREFFKATSKTKSIAQKKGDQ